jgi:hypothetical protein
MTRKKCDPFMAFAALLFSILAMTARPPRPYAAKAMRSRKGNVVGRE